jgi:hypothetical protein
MMRATLPAASAHNSKGTSFSTANATSRAVFGASRTCTPPALCPMRASTKSLRSNVRLCSKRNTHTSTAGRTSSTTSKTCSAGRACRHGEGSRMPDRARGRPGRACNWRLRQHRRSSTPRSLGCAPNVEWLGSYVFPGVLERCARRRGSDRRDAAGSLRIVASRLLQRALRRSATRHGLVRAQCRAAHRANRVPAVRSHRSSSRQSVARRPAFASVSISVEI